MVKLTENAEIPSNSGHKLCMDNFFTLVSCIQFISEIGICAKELFKKVEQSIAH